MRAPLLVSFVAATAFAPDQPGVGDSTGTVPHQHSMIEVGGHLGGVLGQTPILLMPAFTGRIGLRGDHTEVRIGLPSLVVPFSGGLVSTPLLLGAKWAGNPDATVRWSIVPTLLAPFPRGNRLGGDVRVNTAWDAPSNDWGVWGTANTFVQNAAVVPSVGGGAYYAPDGVGMYANGEWSRFAGEMVGGGGWWMFAEDAQTNLGVDVWPGLPATVFVHIGASIQR